MAKEFSRHQRYAREVYKKIAIILQKEIKDPRINIIITVSSVEISRDLAYAKIFVTFLPNKNEKITEVVIKILQNASGFIRSLLAKSMHLRIVPKLTFFYDNSLLEGIRIANLATNIIKNDKERYVSFNKSGG